MHHHSYGHVRRLVVLLVAILSLQAALAHAAQGNRAANSSVSNWLAWKTFHDSLAFYARQSTAKVDDLLAGRLGLTPTEAADVLTEGQSFLAAIQRN